MWLSFTQGANSGEARQLLDGNWVLGRDETCDIVVEDDKVSRRHARLDIGGGQVQLVDLGSTNGTYVDGRRLNGATPLWGGERVRIGSHGFSVSANEPDSGTGRATVIDLPAASPPVSNQPLANQVPPAGTGAVQRVQVPYTPPAAVATFQPQPASGGANGSGGTNKILVGAIGGVAVLGLVAALLFVTGLLPPNDDEEPAVFSTRQIVDNARPSTVLVTSSVFGDPIGSGTGWVLDADEGLIVTNQHVLNDGMTFSITLDGDERPAQLLASAPCEDLALLSVDDTAGMLTLPLGDQSAIGAGDEVVAVGFPGSASVSSQLSATTGVVSVAQTTFDELALDVPMYSNVIQTDAAINPGNSGGPLLDRQGRLVGVNSAGITLQGDRIIQNQGYAIGVDRVKDITTELKDGRSRAWTGMGFFYPTSDEDFDSFGLPVEPGGIIVTHAVPGTPAAEAGVGDEFLVMLAADGESLDGTLASYCAAVGDRRSGDTGRFRFVDGSGSARVLDIGFN